MVAEAAWKAKRASLIRNAITNVNNSYKVKVGVYFPPHDPRILMVSSRRFSAWAARR